MHKISCLYIIFILLAVAVRVVGMISSFKKLTSDLFIMFENDNDTFPNST